MEVGELTSPVGQYLHDLKNEDQAAANHLKTDVQDQNKISSLEKEAPSIDNVDQFLNNYGVRHAVMDAYGMKNLAGATYLIKKLLTQDPSDPKSLAKTSNNATWQSFADAFKVWGANGGSVQMTPFTKPIVEAINSAYQDRTQSDAKQDTSTFSMQAIMIHSASDLLNARNATALKVVLGAYDVSDLAQGATNADGTANTNSTLYKLLSQDLSDSNSVAWQSKNPAWINFAGAFDGWGRNGGQDTVMMDAQNVAKIASQYLEKSVSSADTSFHSFVNSANADIAAHNANASSGNDFYSKLLGTDSQDFRTFIGGVYNLGDNDGDSADDVKNLLPLTSSLSAIPQGAFVNSNTRVIQLLKTLKAWDDPGKDRAVRDAVDKVYNLKDQDDQLNDQLSNNSGRAITLKTASTFFTNIAQNTPDADLNKTIGSMYMHAKLVSALQQVVGFNQAAGSIKSASDLIKNSTVLHSVFSAFGVSAGDAIALSSDAFNKDGSVNTSSKLFHLLTKGSSGGDSEGEANLAAGLSGLFNSDSTGSQKQAGKSVFVDTDGNLNGVEQKIEGYILSNATHGDDADAAASTLSSANLTQPSDLFETENADAWKIVSTAFNLPAQGQSNVVQMLGDTQAQPNQESISKAISKLSDNADWQDFVSDFGSWVADQKNSSSNGSIPNGVKSAVELRYVQKNNPSGDIANGINEFINAAGSGSLDSVSDLAKNKNATDILTVMLGAAGVKGEDATSLISGMLPSGSGGSLNESSDLYNLLTKPEDDSQPPWHGLTGETLTNYQNISNLFSTWNKNGGHDTNLLGNQDFVQSISSDYQFKQGLKATQVEQDFSQSATQLKTDKDLLGNAKDLQMVQGEYGLDPQQDTQALFQILLTNDPDSKTSFAKMSGNKAWQSFAQDFSMWGKNNGGVGGSSPFLTGPANTMLSEIKQQEDVATNAAVGHFTDSIKNIRTVGQLIGDDSGDKGDPTALRVLLNAAGLGKEFSSAFATSDPLSSFASDWTTSSPLYKTLDNLLTYDAGNPNSDAAMLGDNAVNFANNFHNLQVVHGSGTPLIDAETASKVAATYRQNATQEADLDAANVQSGFASLTTSDLISNDVSDEGSLARHPAVIKALLQHFGLDIPAFGMNVQPGDGYSSLTDTNGVVDTKENDSSAWTSQTWAWKNIVNLIEYDPTDTHSIIHSPPGGTSAQQLQNEKDFSNFFSFYRMAPSPQYNDDMKSNIKAWAGLPSESIATTSDLLSDSNRGALETLLKNLHVVGMDYDSEGHLSSKSLALVKTLLTQDPNDPNSFVNKVSQNQNSSNPVFSVDKAQGEMSWKEFADQFYLDGQSDRSGPAFLSDLGHTVISHYSDKINDQITGAINGFESVMSSAGSADDFIQNPQLGSALYAYSIATNEPDVAQLAQGAVNADGSVNKSSNLYNLLTQDPTLSTSTAQISGNKDWLDFVHFYQSITQDPNDVNSYVYKDLHPSLPINQDDVSPTDWGKIANVFRQPEPHHDRIDALAYQHHIMFKLMGDFASASLDSLSTATSNFAHSIGSVTNAADMIQRPGVMNLVGEAYGMDAQSNEHEILKLLMTQDPNSPTSIASMSGVSTWHNFAHDMRSWGESGGSVSPSPFTPARLHSIVSEYEKTQYETDKTNTKDGVGNALYFTRKIAGVHNIYQLMSDQKLMDVVEEVNGLDPDEFGALDFDEQYRILDEKVKFSDFSTPERIRHYAERYLVMNQIHPQQVDQPETLMSLFGGNSDDDGILSLFGDDNENSDSTLALFGVPNSFMGHKL